MRKRRSVALLIETSNAYARGVLEGVISYVRQHDAWSIFLPEHHRGERLPSWISRWRGDGVIARIETDEIARALIRTKLPVVDVSAARHAPNIPWVETDDVAIAKLAADHLLDRGFRALGFCGESDFNWSLWRKENFVRLALEAGCSCHVYESLPRRSETTPGSASDAAWLPGSNSFPSPLACWPVTTSKPQVLLDVCRELNIAVPEEIAVIGVDNDGLICALCSPPLSSVIPNSRRTGYEAAALLDRMMAGEKVSAEALLIEPLGVQIRQSTDVLALPDPAVASAVRFIREHACTGIDVNAVLRHTRVSRRVTRKSVPQNARPHAARGDHPDANRAQ